MELDEFIKSVLVKVLSGIKQAQEESYVGAFVVPSGDGGMNIQRMPGYQVALD